MRIPSDLLARLQYGVIVFWRVAKTVSLHERQKPHAAEFGT